MSDKLGFTFYPKDWWTSESYFELTPIQRYYYLECLFIMYSNDGFMKTQKTQFENRTRTQVLENDWICVTEKFILESGQFTHPSVNKRLKKAVANRENGKKGGRPSKPKKPNLETQNNPPLESEREGETETKKESKNKMFFTELNSSHSWLESVAMQNKNKFKKDVVIKKLNEFYIDCENRFDYKENKTEFTSHFVRWLDKQEKQTFNSPA